MIYVVTGTCNPYFFRVVSESIIRKTCSFKIDNFEIDFDNLGNPSFHMERSGKFDKQKDDSEIFFNTYRTVLQNGFPKCLDEILKTVPKMVFSPAFEHTFLNILYPDLYISFESAFNRDLKTIQTMLQKFKDFCVCGVLHKKFIDELKKNFEIKVINIKRNPSCDFLFDEDFNFSLYEQKVKNFLELESEFGSVRFEDFLKGQKNGIDISEIFKKKNKWILESEFQNKENLDLKNLEPFNDLANFNAIFSKLGYSSLTEKDIFN